MPHPVTFPIDADGVEVRVCGDSPAAQSYRLARMVLQAREEPSYPPGAAKVMFLELQQGEPQLIPHVASFTLDGGSADTPYGSLVRVAGDHVERLSAHHWNQGYLFVRDPAGTAPKRVREFFIFAGAEAVDAAEFARRQHAALAAYERAIATPDDGADVATAWGAAAPPPRPLPQ